MKSKLTKLILGLTLSGMLVQAPLHAQHEVDTEAGDRAPIVISGNENAYGYSQMAMMAMMQAMERANRYARSETRDLIAAIAEREGVDTDWVIPTPGSGPVLQMAALAYVEEGKNMITVEPGYTQLTRLFDSQGGEVKYVPLNDELAHDLAAMEAAIDEDTVLVYICNPNNPTGTIVDPAELAAFIDRVPDDVLVFVDEAYLEVSEAGLEANSMIGSVRENENVLLARTFSKVFGMAGLRVGYGVAHPSIIEKLDPYYMGAPNLLAAVAGTAALRDTAHMEQNRSEYMRVREMVTDRLDELGVEYADPQGTFVFLKTGMDVEEFQDLMANQRIHVGRPFPPMTEWARVSIGTEEEMQVFLSVFESIMREHDLLAAN